MVAVECKTQDEADAAAARGDVIVWREGLLVARGSARADLYGSASARLYGSARAYLYDSASAVLRDSARAYLYDSARVNAYDWARVYEGKTGRPLRQSRPVILIGPIGSRSAMLSVYQCEDGGQLIRAGCFVSSRDEFAAAVAATHPTGQFADEYRAALAMIDALKGGRMSAKHTPGPWIVSDMNKVPLGASTLATVAHVGDYQIGIETGRPGGDYRSGLHGDEAADAALIAAAPEMYEALRDLIAVKPNSDAPEWVAARAAIAKAEGRQ